MPSRKGRRVKAGAHDSWASPRFVIFYIGADTSREAAILCLRRETYLNRRDLLRLAGVTLAPASAKTAAPSRFFDVKNFGAAADGKTLDTEAIRRAVDVCHTGGGGVVYLAG